MTPITDNTLDTTLDFTFDDSACANGACEIRLVKDNK